jgi:alkylation response protein AidB-like acyl-CoA dehydrogenase
MDFELSAEQRLFRDTIRAFADDEIRPVAVQLEASGEYPERIVAMMAQMGLFGLTVPADFGGMAADLVSYALAFEEISRAWMGVAGIVGSHSLSCWMIDRYGTVRQRRELLPDLAAGTRRTGIALTEPAAGTDLQGIETVARADGGDYVITGRKMWITNARHADPLPVLVKTDPRARPAHRGMSVFLVPAQAAGADGFRVVRDLPKLGYHGPETCEVVLDEVRVPATALLGGTEGHGLQQVLAALEIGRINIAARAVGVAQAAYDEALRYAGQREAFGQPIAQFQAIQLKLADMATRIQAARLLTYWAAARAEAAGRSAGGAAGGAASGAAGGPAGGAGHGPGGRAGGGGRADMESGMAKVFASEVAVECALSAMQIHGAYGYSREFVVERLYRDAPLMAIGEGTNDALRMVIARALISGRGKLP